MALENALYPDELDPSSPNNTTDDPFGANALYLEIQQQKDVWTNTFANVSGAVTATDVEMNYLDIATLGTAETSKALTISATDTWNVAGMTCSNLGIVTTLDLNGGSIDDTTVGAATPSTGAFTTLSASGAVTLNSTLALASGTTANEISIDGTLAGDSDDAIPTEKAVKTYVDSATGGGASTAYVDARVRTIVNAVLADVSNSETVWVVVPVTGTITRVDTVLEGAITVADATVTVTTAASAAIASLVITQSGSAAGDVDSDTVLTNDSVTAGDALKVSTDGGSSTSQRLWVSITVDNS